MKSVYVRSPARSLTFVLALGLATPAQAQAENPTRRAAAVADFRKSCATQIVISGKASAETDYLFTHYRGGALNYSDDTILMGVDGLRRVLPTEIAGAARHNDRSRLGVCVIEVALRHALYGVPGYDRGAGGARSSAPAPRANIAAKPAAQPAASGLEPRDEAFRIRLVSEIDALRKRYRDIVPCAWRGDGSGFQNPCLKNNFQNQYIVSQAVLAMLEKSRSRISPVYYSLFKTEWETNGLAYARTGCANLSRSTTPCNLSDPGSRQTVAARNRAAGATGTAFSSTRSRIIASDGKSAMHCVSIKQLASGTSALTGGGKVILNGCGEPVEAVWCYVNGDCNTTGAQVPLQANRSWPIDGTKEVRFAACLGKGTVRFEDGSKGLRYVCTAPR